MVKDRKELGDRERIKMETWGSLLEMRKSGWSNRNRTEEEKARRRAHAVRKLWQKMVDDLEGENRQYIKDLLENENIRRIKTRPEPHAHVDACLPLCEIPRALIEFSDEQVRSLGPEPPRAPINDAALALIYATTDEWRQRYLSSRASAKADRVA